MIKYEVWRISYQGVRYRLYGSLRWRWYAQMLAWLKGPNTFVREVNR